jgi:predicted transcriptional regulator
MSTLTIRLSDDKHARLRRLAKHREMSVNKLMEELATISLSEFDAETRFRTLACRGSTKKGLAVLDRLDAEFAKTIR